ncbi:MAG: RDD family protein [Rhizobiales bacterium]|nr:RDD family protein [Hyphomicrobiales bacterium]
MSRSGDVRRYAFDPVADRDLFDGVLSKRVVAFVLDAIIVLLLMIPAALVVFLLGIITLGLGWFLYGGLFAIVAIGYVAFTLGGRNSATVGMRWAGIELTTADGGPSYPALAILHALIFWFSCGLLTPLVLLVGLVTSRKQLLHDLILGTLVVNSAALVRRAARFA